MRTTPRLFFILNFISLTALAHPVSYKGATSMMSFSTPTLKDNWVTYSFENNMALSFRLMNMKMKDNSSATLLFPQMNTLLKRWNTLDAQSNIYLYGGVGTLTSSDTKNWNSSLLIGAEADSESRSLFTLLKVEGLYTKNQRPSYQSEFRLGIAPYEAEFSELASWLMIKAEVHPQLKRNFDLTPMIRVFYRNFLTELGMSIKGDTMINFMFHF